MIRKSVRGLLFLCMAVSLLAAGCGQRAGEQTEAQTQKQETETRKMTEAPTEAVTEAATEAPTEAVTEAQTEAPPAPVRVQPEVKEDLTFEEESELEEEFVDEQTYYAIDDINVRSTPDTENNDNVISSYDQGEIVTVIGETPNWYKVRREDWTGYVFKDNLSETAVEPKTPEERSEAADAEAEGQAARADEGEEPADHSAEAANTYAEGFTVEVASDANLRSDASDQANIIGLVNAGQIITAIGESDNWYQVDVDGTVGYINKNLISQ